MFDIRDHYWIIGGNDPQIWSSKQVAFVDPANAYYVEWTQAGGVPTAIDSVPSLAQVLNVQWMPAALTTVTVTSTATPALDGVYAIDLASQTTIVALSTGIAASRPLPGGGTTFEYPDATGAVHEFTASDFLNFAYAIEDYVYSFGVALRTRLAGGTADLPSADLTIP